ncbi:hypothetical protein BDF19DRAFT_410183 [Syncephalis fuscata]|nr:hypothetical protein BDF19DRAFT_410183 [Syncephalis fuscata]
MEPGQDLDRNQSELASLEQSLLSSFRTAARSVTQLYKDAQRTQRFAYRQGYEQCLQDLLDFLAGHPHVQQREVGLGAASIPADDLVNYAQAKHAELMVETEKSPPPPSATASATTNNDVASSSVSTNGHPVNVQNAHGTLNSTNHASLGGVIFGGVDTTTHPFQFVPPPLASTATAGTTLTSNHASILVNNGTPSTMTVPFKRRHPPNEMSFLGRDVDMSDFESHTGPLSNSMSSLNSTTYNPANNGTAHTGNMFNLHGHNNNAINLPPPQISINNNILLNRHGWLILVA